MNNNVITQDTLADTILIPKPEPIESPDIKVKTNVPLSSVNTPIIPIINPSKIQQPQNHFDSNIPLNVSIRLPEKMSERKNLMKCNIENHMDMKDLKFNAEGLLFNSDIKQEPIKFPPQQEYKKESITLKQECPKMEKDFYGKLNIFFRVFNAFQKINIFIKYISHFLNNLNLFSTDLKEETNTETPHVLPSQQVSIVQEKPFKTELIIPKIHTMEKPLIKEELDLSNDSRNINLLNINSNLNPKDENTIFNENLYIPQSINPKETVPFGRKEPPFINHLQSKHALNLKETPIDMHKDQIININHSNFMNAANEIKQEPFGYQNPPPSQPQPEKSTAGNISDKNNI